MLLQYFSRPLTVAWKVAGENLFTSERSGDSECDARRAGGAEVKRLSSVRKGILDEKRTSILCADLLPEDLSRLALIRGKSSPLEFTIPPLSRREVGACCMVTIWVGDKVPQRIVIIFVDFSERLIRWSESFSRLHT